MKKVLFACIALLGLCFLPFNIMAQPGTNCSTPYVIPLLPFNQTGLSTSGFGDDYDNSMACTSDFMTGEDFVFAYTPGADQLINVSLSGTGQYVGLFVIDSCPSLAGAICAGLDESIFGNNQLTNVALTAGHTYYILIDTQDPILGFIPNPSTAFNIDITATNPLDAYCNSIVAPAVSSCDLGIESLTVNITNNGIVDIDTFDISYSINGALPVVETYYAVLGAGASADYTFATTADLSNEDSTYNISAWTSLLGDGVPGNDTVALNITHTISIASFPYHESFEAGNAGWTAGGGNSSWAVGAPSGAIINAASDGLNVWKTNLSGNYNAGETSYVVSPCLDFTSLTVPMITFDIWYDHSGLLDNTVMEYSTDEGATWSLLGAMNEGSHWYNGIDGWVESSNGWLTASHKLDGLGGLSSVLLRVYFTGSFVQQAEGFAFDHLRIAEAPSTDVGIIAITSPVTFCGLGNEAVTVLVHNFGTVAQANVPVSYNVNGGSWVNESIPVTIAPDASVSYTFVQNFNFSVMQSYDVIARTALAGDTLISNDSAFYSVTNQTYVSTYPYSEDFESGDGGWVAQGLNSSFALGTPVAPIINHASSGSNAWVTNLIGNANMFERSWVESPCLDFTSLTLPVFEMNLWYETSGMLDSVKLEYSIDSGASWVNVGAMNDWQNWYNVQGCWSGHSGNYITVKHTLPNCGGIDNVKLRIRYAGGNMPVEGVAFDDITIYDAPDNDMGVTSIEAPTSDCGLGMETVVVKIRNYGSNDQLNFPIKYSLNGGSSWTTENVAFTVYQNEEVWYTFATPANLIAQGTYELIVTTALLADEDVTNDTASSIIYNTSIASFPYSENFEGDNGSYTTTDTSSWTWGAPSAPIINHAASGANAWVTNLTGEHMLGENSSLVSPCFDLSTLSNPFIEFNIWYQTTFLGGVSVEGSVDGGASWTTIGSSSDSTWYDGFIVTGFSGASGGWVLRRHALDNMAGQTNCKIRIHFNGGSSFLGLVDEGVGIDDLKVYECILPQASFTGNLIGSSISCNNTSTNGASYLWDFGDGSTATTLNTSHTYAASGSYTVSLTVTNDCGQDIYSQNFNVSGMDEHMSSGAFVCQPNPTTGIFSIDFQHTTLTNARIKILDVTGRVIVSETLENTQYQILRFDLGNQQPGVFYISVASDEAVYTEKLIVN